MSWRIVLASSLTNGWSSRTLSRRPSGELALDDLLADVLGLVGDLLQQEPLLVLELVGGHVLAADVHRVGAEDVDGQVLAELAELLVAGDEVGLAVDLDHRPLLAVVVDVDLDPPGVGGPAGAVLGVLAVLGLGQLDGLLLVAVGLFQERLALHQAEPGLLAKLIDGLGRDLGHQHFSLRSGPGRARGTPGSVQVRLRSIRSDRQGCGRRGELRTRLPSPRYGSRGGLDARPFLDLVRSDGGAGRPGRPAPRRGRPPGPSPGVTRADGGMSVSPPEPGMAASTAAGAISAGSAGAGSCSATSAPCARTRSPDRRSGSRSG